MGIFIVNTVNFSGLQYDIIPRFVPLSGYSGISGYSGLPASLTSLNYAQNVATGTITVTFAATKPATIHSVTLTANGNPVVIAAYGDVS